MLSALLLAAVPMVMAAGGGEPTDGNRATPQGGVLEGINPSKYDPKNPIILFIIQVCGIVFFYRSSSLLDGS